MGFARDSANRHDYACRAGGIPDYCIGRRRIAVVALRFHKCVIDQRGRALEILRLRRVSGKCAAVHGAEQIARLRISDDRFWNDNSDRPISGEIAFRKRCSAHRFGGNANDQTHDGRSHSAVFEGDHRRIAPVGSHADIELLGVARSIALRGVRVPVDPPSAVRWWPAGETSYFHLEREISRSRRFSDCDVINCQRCWRLTVKLLLGVIRWRLLHD